MKLTGTVKREDLGPGVFMLDTGSQSYVLAGGDKALRKAGQKVEVDGELDETAMTAGGSGPVFRVKTYRVL